MLEQLFRILSACFLFNGFCGTLGAIPIDNLTCLMPLTTWSHEDYLEVNWTLPADWPTRHNADGLSVNVTWGTGPNEGYCNHVTLTSCRWYKDYDDQAMHFNTIFSLNVTVTVDTDTVAVGKWSLDPQTCGPILPPVSSIMKPPTPDVLKLHPTSSRCITVNFGYSDRMDCIPTFNETYQVRWKSVDNEVYSTMLLNASCNSSIQLCYLSPYTRYEVGVACMKQQHKDVGIGHWSDIIMTTHSTLQDIPSESPQLTPGGFQYDKKDCQTNSSRIVTVYWKELDANKRNGEIVGYNMSVRNMSGRYGYNIADGSAESYTIQLLCNSSYTVQLIARTVVGFSTVPSVMTIDVYKDSAAVIAIPELNYNNSEVDVSWSVEDANTTDVTGWTILWCAKNLQGYCKGHVNWTVIWGSAQTATIPFPFGRLAIHYYMYGVSLLTAAGQGGVTWQRCLFLSHYDLPTPRGIKLREMDKAGALIVEWENPPCEALLPGPYIDHFVIDYCDMDGPTCKNEGRTMSVDGRTNLAKLKDTVTEVSYGVTVTSVDRNGNRSLPSDVIIGGLHSQGGLPLLTVILIIIGGVALLLVSGVGMIPLLRMIKGLFRAPAIADIPEVQELLEAQCAMKDATKPDTR